MQVVGSGSKVWRQVGVGSGDAGSLLNCDPNGKNVLLLWAEIVSKRDLKGLPKVRKVKLDQGTDEWLKWRNQGLGGSEVGCVMGANPYRGSQAPDVWGRKLPDDHPDKVPEVGDNYAMARGRKLEPDAREMYEQLFGWKAEPVCVIHDQYEFVRASLDGLRDDHQVALEIKCSGKKNHASYLEISRIGDDLERQRAFASAFPAYYLQVAYQLLITEAPTAHFCGYSPDFSGPDRLACFALYPEPSQMARLLERVVEFWGYVERREPIPAEWLVPCWTLPEEIKVPATTSV